MKPLFAVIYNNNEVFFRFIWENDRNSEMKKNKKMFFFRLKNGKNGKKVKKNKKMFFFSIKKCKKVKKKSHFRLKNVKK